MSLNRPAALQIAHPRHYATTKVRNKGAEHSVAGIADALWTGVSMSVARESVQEILSGADPASLRAVLESSGISTDDSLDSEGLSQKLVRALWWRTHTPIGLFAVPDSLGKLVDRTAQRLKLPLDEALDDWDRLDSLTEQLLTRCEGVDALHDLDPKHINRLKRSQWLAWTGASVAGGTAASGYLSQQLLRMTAPYRTLLPLIPGVGPALVAARKGVEQVARFSTPVSITLALASANQALGPEYDRALALLLGVALVRPRNQQTYTPSKVVPFVQPSGVDKATLDPVVEPLVPPGQEVQIAASPLSAEE